MTDPHLILHLGAPKCASSALQAALTARPDHSASTLDRPLRYVGCRHGRSGLRPFYGAAVRALGQRSVYGYLNWPNLSPETRPAALATGLTRALDRARSLRHVPILSSEGWLAHPGWFAEELKARGNPPVDAVVYLRPPVDWINAAWWQWGIWGAPSLDAWLDRGTPLYRFGPLLEAWAAIPNLRLHIRPTRPDAVADFAALYGITLPAPSVRNAAAPPSLTGFFCAIDNSGGRRMTLRRSSSFSAGARCRMRPGPGPSCRAMCTGCVPWWPKRTSASLPCCRRRRLHCCSRTRAGNPRRDITTVSCRAQVARTIPRRFRICGPPCAAGLKTWPASLASRFPPSRPPWMKARPYRHGMRLCHPCLRRFWRLMPSGVREPYVV